MPADSQRNVINNGGIEAWASLQQNLCHLSTVNMEKNLLRVYN